MGSAAVDLYWLPLGAGDNTGCVRWNGGLFEALSAWHGRRKRRDIYHSALEVRLDGERFVIEMTPAWGSSDAERGVVCEGPVGLPWLGRSRFFRYEVRRWRGGAIPDVSEAVDSPRSLPTSRARARLLLDAVPAVPALTWGRDEAGAGEMWNSNSLVSWLLARSGHDTRDLRPPVGGRAPGWAAGLVLARCERSSSPGRDSPHAQPSATSEPSA